MISLTEAIGGAPVTIADLLEWPARLYPDRCAVHDGAGAVTFHQLRERAIARSRALAELGVRRFERWGVVAEHSAEFFVTLFALARLGAAAAPVQRNQPLGRYLQARLTGLLAPPTSRFDQAQAAPFSQVVETDNLRMFSAAARPLQPSPQEMPIDVDPALVIWSSGSTRAARGVVLEHGAVLANVRANVQALGLREQDRTLVVLPVAHAYALIHQCLCHLAIGATVCCPPAPLLAPALCRSLAALEITTLTTAPPVLRILVEGLRRTGHQCPQLRLVTVGAGRAHSETLAAAMDLLPDARFAITYGLTEAGPRVATGFLERSNLDPACVGAPLPNVEIRIAPRDNGASEIVVRGRSLMRGYADEAVNEGCDHSLHTSDLGEIHDGRLYVRGRLDRAINRGGTVYAAEPIEQVLLRHPAVESARVESESHPFWGQAPVAVLVLKDLHVQPSAEELRQLCASCLSPAEVPVRFDFQDESARTSSKDRQMMALLEGDLETSAVAAAGNGATTGDR